MTNVEKAKMSKTIEKAIELINNMLNGYDKKYKHVIVATYNGVDIVEYSTAKEAGKALGIHHNTISKVVGGFLQDARGYGFYKKIVKR